MDQKININGVIWWYPESTGVADANTKPSSYTLTLGIIDSDRKTSFSNDVTYEEVYSPKPGMARLTGREATKVKQTISVPIVDMNRRTWEIILNATLSGETGDQAFVPGEQPQHRGWGKLQGYNMSAGGEKFLMEVFAQAEAQSTDLMGGVIRPTIMLHVFHSTAAAGTIKSIG